MPAIAHQNKILGNTSGGGSTILVTTSESTLYGQTVTLSDGTTTMSGTFSNTGECEFTGVMMVGTLTATSSTASTSINVPYFGVYSMTLSFFSATITATFPSGATCTCVGNGETYTASTSPHTFTVHGAATYTVGATIDGASKQTSVVISTDGQTASVALEFGTIVLTYDNDFRGKTITCTKGGAQTITKTAPSSGNTMYFYPPTTGNWTISGTVSSDTFYSTPNPVVVSSLSTSVSATLETIPDGSTKTPTDDVSIWLSCAGIRDKAYTTLTEVLSDSETFNALLGDSNACAYMARSTTFAGSLDGLVPTMTDDTHPSGEVIYGSQYDTSTYSAVKAFDNNSSTRWNSDNQHAVDYIGYMFSTPTVVNKVKISVFINDNKKYFKHGYVQGYDGTDWTNLSEISVANDSNADSTFTFANNTAYEGYRVYCDDSYYQANAYSFWGVQFYRDGMTTNQYAMSMIGQYDVCCDALLGNATWASAIADSTYSDYVLNVKVPVMTSDTTPSGECIAHSIHTSGTAKYYAFDGNASTAYIPLVNEPNNDYYIGYEFPSPVKIYKAVVTGDSYNNAYYYDNAVYCGNDLSALTKISGNMRNQSNSDVPNTQTSVFDCPNAYKYFVLKIADTNAQSAFVNTVCYNKINTIQFYGRTSSNELIHGTNNESAYYLDGASEVAIVDPSTLSAGTYTFGSTVAKDPSDLTADYTKTIRITPNTKEIVLRPDNSLYWWGYVSPIVEVISTANGWTIDVATIPPTFNDYNMSISTTLNSNASGIGTKIKIDGVSHVIMSATADYGGYYADIISTSQKNTSSTYDIERTRVNSTSLAKYDSTTSVSRFLSFVGYYGMANTLYAMWH